MRKYIFLRLFRKNNQILF